MRGRRHIAPWICIGLMVACFLSAGCNRHERKKNGPLKPGDDAQLTNRGVDIPVAKEPKKLEAYLAADTAAQQKMVADGDVLMMKDKTDVTLGHMGGSSYRVHIQRGPHKGKDGWAPKRMVER